MTTPPDPSSRPQGPWPPAGAPAPPWPHGQPTAPPGWQWQPTGPPGPQPQPGPAGTPWPPTVSWLGRGLGAAILLCGAMVVAGAFLTWGVTDLGGKENFTTPGHWGDGRITAFFGAVLVLAGVVRLAVRRRGAAQVTTGVVATVASAVTTLIAVVDVVDISDPSRDGSGLVSAEVYVGAGLWLTLVAGIVGLLTAVAALIRRD